MNAGIQLNALRPRIEKTCSKCGAGFTGYKNGGDLCKKCYNTEFQRKKRAKAKQS